MLSKPNVLFIFSDQQRWDTVSCYGEPLGKHFQLTPHLDQLAAEGTRFENAMTCQPVCGPARACIQTGKYPTSIGCEVNDRMLPLDEKGIASWFHEYGYETAYVGKWHLASHRSFRPGPDSVDHKITAIPEPYRAATVTSGLLPMSWNIPRMVMAVICTTVTTKNGNLPGTAPTR